MKSLLVLVLALAVLVGAAPDARAQFQQSFLIKRPGLHNSKFGPGAARRCKGDLLPATPGKSWDPQLDAVTSVTLSRSATGGCSGTPSVTFAGDSFFVNWGGECVQAGDFVILTFKSTTAINGNGVVWQDNFFTTVDTGSFTKVTFPALDPRGMVLLTVGLAGLGIWALRRRRTEPDAI